jgi:imidazolonepropionase-like amidohydrolase
MRLDAVKAAHRPVILPLNFPDVPAVQTPEQALQISLTDLRYWDEAPENPKQLQEAGVTLALTSATLKDPGTYLARLRTAVQRGLPQEAALAALTTTPARLFGIEKRLGTIEQGKQANFIITSGDLFSEKTVIHESWINGKRYEVKPAPDIDPRGTWRLTIAGPFPPGTTTMTIKGEPDALQGAIRRNRDIPLSTVSLDGLRLLFSFSADSLGSSGMVRMTGSFINDSLAGTGEWTDGRTVAWSASRVTPFVAPTDTSKKRPPIAASFPPDYPHGEFGRRALPDQPTSILIRGATVWTCGPGGRIDTGDVLFGKGKILGVGKNLHLPPAALVIDGKGKHVTPGLIDAHSHIAVSGNVNEAARAVSAQVRIADVLNSDDISIYRQLAGGLTEAHVLHGSANPIGGQCQLIKLRWGMLPDDLVFAGAPPTIKFALGENVKQSNWGERYTVRYPQTRMGVEQLMRDEFRAALDYEQRWKAYERNNAGLPPRRDLELEAILEVIHGKRLVHCHSYRQDELLAMMRVADDFGFHIQTFQHVLEGYKVADIMAKHGASGSTFTDWWAYKFEVYDAIPYNGVLMHDQGILVSFNSDDAELARRLNLEAAKAMKYGGLPDTEALKFVTINPARQLRVDKLVGSLEPGKDADLVIWSGNPLSSFSRCEQTWIDGRKYFDRVEDRALYEEAMHERSVLVQKALAAKKAPPGSRRPGSPGMEIEEGR